MIKAESGAVFVVFGAGYVGGELARRLKAEGKRVVALTRNEAKAAALAAEGIEAVCADLGGADWTGYPALKGPVAAVAVTVAAGGGGAEGYRRSYVEGLAQVVAWGGRRVASGVPTGPLVYTSSTAVYPQGEGRRVTEDEPVGGEAETTSALIQAEKLALAWPGAGAVVLRLAGIYGPGRVHLVEQVRRGEVSGNEQAYLNLIHRDDIPPAMVAAWQWLICGVEGGRRQKEVFNLCDGTMATKGEIVRWLVDRLGVPPVVFTGLPAGGRRMVTPNRIIDSTKARLELGWLPRVVDYRMGYGPILSSNLSAYK